MPDNNGLLLPNENMTQIVESVPGSSMDQYPPINEPSQGGTTVDPSAPSFKVPSNPLLPPGYQETLDYTSLQYANGFYRTQIGRYVRVDQLMGSNSITTQEGFLIGVGYNYLILQEGYTGNILIVDIYTVKNMYVYYNDPVSQFISSTEPNNISDI